MAQYSFIRYKQPLKSSALRSRTVNMGIVPWIIANDMRALQKGVSTCGGSLSVCSKGAVPPIVLPQKPKVDKVSLASTGITHFLVQGLEPAAMYHLLKIFCTVCFRIKDMLRAVSAWCKHGRRGRALLAFIIILTSCSHWGDVAGGPALISIGQAYHPCSLHCLVCLSRAVMLRAA